MRITDAQLTDLQKLVADRQVVLILGEGVSYEVSGRDPRATLKGLLLDGIARCGEQPHLDQGWCARQRALVEHGRMNEQVAVAGLIKEELGEGDGGEFKRWLRESVGALKAVELHLVQTLAALDCPIATTTPDLLVSQALGLPAVSWDQTNEVERMLRGDARGVLHLHGHWQDPDSLVLGVRDRTALQRSPHARAVLTALRATKSLLFLGSGDPPDPNMAAWLRWSGEVFAGSEYRCYRLEPDAKVEATQALHPPEQRLFVLGYGSDASDLAALLGRLSPRTSPSAYGSADANADGRALLAQLRAVVREGADVLPGVFHLAGGPDALSEVSVELVLRPEQEPCAPDDLSPRARDHARAFGRAYADMPTEPFPLRRLLDLPHKRWTILGEPGSGKTTSLKRFAQHVVVQTELLPLLLRVSEVFDVDQVLDTLVPGYRAAFWLEAGSGKVVLLVDGLDEATDPPRARKALQSLSARLGPSLMVVSSRSTAYEPAGGRLRELMLCPLRREQQEALLRGWLPSSRHGEIPGHMDHLSRHGRMARLAENPLILTLIARLLREGQPLPARRVELYRDVVHLLLTRGHNPDLSVEERPFEESAGPVTALGWLALHGHAQDAEQLSLASLRARMAAAPEDVRDTLGGERLERWLRRIAVGAGLLEPDRTCERWSFAHRTFREYLAARALADDVARHGGVRKAGLGSELDRRLAEAKAKPALWTEVFALLTGLLAGDETEALVTRLVESDEGYKRLLFRVLADAEGLKEKTVWGVLGLAAERGEWETRAKVLRGLSGLVGELSVAVRLLWRFARGSEHGADLFWAHHLLSEIAAGRIGEGADEEARAEAGLLAARVFREHRPQERREVLRRIEARGWWKPIPKGHFWMGSPENERGRTRGEGPRHQREIVRGFEMLAVPVTNGLYERFDLGHASERDDFKEYGKGLAPGAQEEVPVYNVSWYEAVAFALWLSGDGVDVRLPAEVEWEYACRGGLEPSTRFWSGDQDDDLTRVGWVGENSAGHPHSVGEKGHPNPFGLHDLHGNVWEWNLDPWKSDYARREGGLTHDPAAAVGLGDPAAPRVLRGGSWFNRARGARSAFRDYGRPTVRYVNQGFRLVRISHE